MKPSQLVNGPGTADVVLMISTIKPEMISAGQGVTAVNTQANRSFGLER